MGKQYIEGFMDMDIDQDTFTIRQYIQILYHHVKKQLNILKMENMTKK